MSTPYVSNAIFWIEVEKISPNPFQPRREFEEGALRSLSESIRMYGVLQPIVVTRKEIERNGGGLSVEYELISGERRLRAAKLAGLSQIPALIRSGEDSDREKLELAIIENLQRQDLNPVERARSFDRLVNEFGLKHQQVADKVGKSREYVSNTLRILALPPEMITALEAGEISEGHTRPLLMLSDKKDEQLVLFKEIISKRLTVREAESLSRRAATERIRNRDRYLDPKIMEMERNFTESLGTRVRIEKGKEGGTIKIDFFSPDDLRGLLDKLSGGDAASAGSPAITNDQLPITKQITNANDQTGQASVAEQKGAIDDRSPQEVIQEENEDIYSLKDFSI